jgi:Transposase, Mutator family
MVSAPSCELKTCTPATSSAWASGHFSAQTGASRFFCSLWGKSARFCWLGLIDGVPESAQSWKELLLDLKRRGLPMGPELAVADGALGFWQVLEEVWPNTRGQRCWVHKTANVLNKLPKSQQFKAKRALQEIWMAETKKDALAAFAALH